MNDPFQVVRDFESALCDYTGAPYCVTTTSCTMALLLAVAWHIRQRARVVVGQIPPGIDRIPPWLVASPNLGPIKVEIPKRTYISVPMSIIHAGGRPTFREEQWKGMYRLAPLPVWDSARWLTSRIWEHPAVDRRSQMMCLSFHWTKHLAIGQGGAILLDDIEAYHWIRQARFDGREEGMTPAQQAELPNGFEMVGWHCYMSPRDAAEGLTRLRNLPRHNEPLPNDDYPDLSQLEIFK